MSKTYFKDLGERVAATAVEASVSLLIVETASWGYEWVPVLTTLLSVIKGIAARYIGNSDEATLNVTN